MQLASITAQQVLMLFVLLAAGYAGGKSGALKPEYRKAFSDLLVHLVLPAMIINAYLVEFDPATFRNLLVAFGLAILLLGGGMLVTLVLTAPMKHPNKDLFRFACSFPNAAYMGFPLISALFGAEGLLYASAFSTIFNVLQWTAGIALINPKTDPREMLRGIVSNKALWAVVIGLTVYLGRIPVPEMLRSPIATLGSMTTPLSMVITGMIVAASDLRDLLRDKLVWGVAALRLLLLPACGLAVLTLLGIQGLVPQVVLLLEACPTAAITSVLAVQYKKDERLAAGAVVVTTLLSILTLPAVALLLTA